MIPILAEHTDFVLVNKPCGVAVQNEQHCAGLLPHLCQQLQLERLWLVHRLDKITSGVLLLAKNADAASRLSQTFALRQVKKYYLALSLHKPKKKQGKVIGDMRKLRAGQWALSHQTINPALTQFFSYSVQPGMRVFIIKPHTGKTHQIRVALKSLGAPILGDALYKGEAADRTYLHAFQLAFYYRDQIFEYSALPIEGEQFLTSAFQNWLTNQPNPNQLNWPVIE